MAKSHNSLEKALKLLGGKNNDVVAAHLKDGVDSALLKITGGLFAEVISAVNLTDEEKLKLEINLAQIFGRSLTATYQTDPVLLGGFKVSVGDWKFDATVVSQLNLMRSQLGGTNG